MKKKQDYFEIDIFRLLKAIWKKAWIVFIVAVLCGVGGYYYSGYTFSPSYTAAALMYVNGASTTLSTSSITITASEVLNGRSLIDTYLVILKTRTTLNMVIERAQLPYTYEQLSGMLTAVEKEETAIFEIRATASDPEEAALIANTTAQVFPERLAEILTGASAAVVDYAVVPKYGSAPAYSRNAEIGFALGLLLSCAVIALLDLLNDQVRDTDMLAGDGTIPVLAEIPNLKPAGNHPENYGYRKSEAANEVKKNEEK